MDNLNQKDKTTFVEEVKTNRSKCYEYADEMALNVRDNVNTFIQYLDTQARLPMFTANNVLMIMKQSPNATQLGDLKYWRDRKLYIKKEEINNPILILEKGDEYTRQDGSSGVYYNPKKVYDLSQINSNIEYKPRTYQVQDLLKIISNNSPVPFKSVNAMELKDGFDVYYDKQENVILLNESMDVDHTQMFQLVSMEIAHALMAKNNISYTHDNNHLEAYCASYVACKAYGVNTDNYKIDFSVGNKDSSQVEIKRTLNNIRNSSSQITGLIKNSLSKSDKEHER